MSFQPQQQQQGMLRANYNVAHVWHELRHKQSKVDWHRLVWCNFHIPRHSMISWLAILDRLPTRYRMNSLGVLTSMDCVLCSVEVETRDHIFFECTYSKQVWGRILSTYGLSRVIGSWQEEFSWVVRTFRGKAIRTIIMRLAWNAHIYFIWHERNRRLHGGHHREEQDIVMFIVNAVNNKLIGIKNSNC